MAENTFTQLQPGVYALEELPEYDLEQSYPAVFVGEPDTLRVHGHVNRLYYGSHMVRKHALKPWMWLLESVMHGTGLMENMTATMSQASAEQIRAAHGFAAAWEKSHPEYDGPMSPGRSRAVLRTASLAGTYIASHRSVGVITPAPLTARKEREQTDRYVANLVGVGVRQCAGGLAVQAVVSGQDFQPGILSSPASGDDQNVVLVPKR